MDPYSALIAAGVQAGSALMGHLMSEEGRREADRLIKEATDEAGNISVPALKEVLAQEVGPSAFESIQADPESVAAQRGALTRLGELADAGYTMEDRAAQTEALRRSGRQEQAGRQRIAGDAAARGQLGGGTTLAMMLQNQQGAAERGADIGLQTAAQSQRRMYEAMRDRASLAGNIRGQDWQEKAQAAQARDAVARYNADARRSAQGANTANQQWNFNARRLLNDDKLRLAAIRAGKAEANADRTQQVVAGVGSGVAQGINTYGQQQQQPPPQQYNYQYKPQDDDGWI